MAKPLIFNFAVEGTEELEAAFASLGDDMLRIGGAALFEEGNAIMNASKNIVPVLDGHLKNSGTTHPPEQEKDKVIVTLSYGGPAVDYAIVQHETPPEVFSHREGQSWKFLQNPALEATRGMAQRIAASRPSLDALPIAG